MTLRRRFWRWTLRLAAALPVAAILAVGCGLLWLQSSLPKLDGELRLPGVEGPVQILRDRYGVPTIRAENAASAMPMPRTASHKWNSCGAAGPAG